MAEFISEIEHLILDTLKSRSVLVERGTIVHRECIRGRKHKTDTVEYTITDMHTKDGASYQMKYTYHIFTSPIGRSYLHDVTIKENYKQTLHKKNNCADAVSASLRRRLFWRSLWQNII